MTLPISAGFRVLPFTYLFAPSWLAITILTALGTWLSIKQRQLIGAFPPWRLRLMALAAVCWMVGMCAAIWIIIPAFDKSGLSVIVAVIAIPAWVLAANTLTWRPIVWVLLWAIAVPLSSLSVVPALVMLLLLVALPSLDPGTPGLVVNTSRATSHGYAVLQQDDSAGFRFEGVREQE